MRTVFFVFFLLVFYSCSEGNGKGYAEQIKKAETGEVVESGFLLNDLKEGGWVTYFDAGQDLGRIKTIANYHKGQLHGVKIQMNARGQLESEETYKNGQLHGKWAKYSFGRLTELANYKEGKIHGKMQKFYRKPGAVQMEAEYKDGVQHGMYRFYAEDGSLQLEYKYDNGKKVSGGIVE